MNQEYLKKLYYYDISTGLFIRKIDRRGGRKMGDISGLLRPDGYVRIVIDKKQYLLHRLAFLYMTGSFPDDEVDHINGVRGDNRWINLRCVSKAENRKNASARLDNKSGYPGIRWRKERSKWAARIWSNGKLIELGHYQTFDEAMTVRKQAEKSYGYHLNHGRQRNPLYL